MEKTFFELINVIEPVREGSCVHLIHGKKVISLLEPINFIKKGMEIFGQDIESVKKHYRKITGFVQKAPILFIGKEFVLFFPTHSDTNEHCLFIQYQHIREIVRSKNDTCILFCDGTIYKTETDARVLKKQMHRCSQYLAEFEMRRSRTMDLLQIKTEE